MTEGERIKMVRQSDQVKQQGCGTLEKFGAKIGVSFQTISLVEKNINNVSDRLRRDICREFKVNETWLRTGEGEMFLPQSRNDLISDFLGDLLSDQPGFRHRLITALATMSENEWAILERKIREITEETPDP